MIDPTHLRLVAITIDSRDGTTDLLERCAAAVRGGVTMVQLREKNVPPRKLVEVARALVQSLSVPVIVNDRADVAIAAGAAGVHLGFEDVPVAAVRRITPEGFIIGASVGSAEEALNAAGADYVGIGPIFSTSSKIDAGDAIGAEGFARLAALCAVPAVAIGGIAADNVAQLGQSGCAGIAVMGAVLGQKDPERAARTLRTALDASGVGSAS